jgi:TRIAD3 protein (E3 ubiquitin-protein ligase RNF216)
MQAYLRQDFPFVSESRLKESLDSFRGLYAPTHVFLARKGQLPIERLVKALTTNGKHRQWHDDEFDKEREWVLEVMTETDECEDGIECGCCFAKFRFVSGTTYFCSFILIILFTAQNDPMF